MALQNGCTGQELISEINNKLDKNNMTGTVLWMASEIIPEGFLLCDGSALLKEDYPALYSILGSAFGEETDTKFYIPDLRAKFIRGSGSNGSYGATFGKTQDATYISPDLGNTCAKNTDYTGSTSHRFNTSSSTSFHGTGFAVRPYNMALTPIIKY